MRRPLSEEDVAGLREGDCLSCDSGLGGSFTMRFERREDDRLVFENQSAEYRDLASGAYTIDEVRTVMYDLLFDPANRHEIESMAGKPFDEVQAQQLAKHRRNG